MPALTRAEAEERARLVAVLDYAIDLDLTRGPEVFGSTTVVRFTVGQPGAATFIELQPAVLRGAVLNGRVLDPASLVDNRLPLTDLRAVNELRVEADMRYSRTGDGLHRFTDPVDGEVYLASQCGLAHAQQVFAAFDQPDLKAPFRLAATAPEGWTVIGNAVGGRAQGPGGGPGRWEFAPTPPISSYLFAVAAGPYHSVRTEHRGIPFALHCRRSLAEHLDKDAEEILDITRACFDRYHQIFDEPYPFDSYDQAFVPELNFGAMENPGCVTFREDFVFRSAVTETERQTRGMVIAHEMAHMWFGNLVTMRWWDDMWLNESFAEYMGYQVLSEVTRFTGSWTEFAFTPRGYDADQRPSTHPVAPEPGDVPDTDTALLIFDGISYDKGAAALRQLVAWLGEKAFLAGINDHFARHRFGNATLADLLDSLDRASGPERDVHGWAERWLRTSGVDALRLVTEPVASGAGAGGGSGPGTGGASRAEAGAGGRRIFVEHTGTRPHRVAVGVYDRAGEGPDGLVPLARVEVDIEAHAERVEVLLPPGLDTHAPALLLLNDGDLSYAKVRYDEDCLAAVLFKLGDVPDPLGRAVLWNTVRDMVRDGELPAADYLELAETHLDGERDTAVVGGVLAFARGDVTDRYLDPAARGDALRRLAGVCREVLSRTEGGGGSAAGLRLAAVRGLLDSVSTAEEVAEVRGWLAEGRLPEGPALDPELRWRALLRLAVLGAVGEREIAAELERDPSATGREGAARCRAALPELEAKRAAWAAMFEGGGEDGELSNYLLTATAQGFWQPEQVELLKEFVPLFFPAAARVSARRGAPVAEALGRHGFPTHVVDEAILREGERCLAEDDPIPALRRKLVDQLDDLRRALRVRRAFG
ncbi:aminopeptidase N [Allostreptomyces psammosilenae]|uniref:Aminopeptidase N n=2 Tax=Allostreptomyces psammosilenae TaxID=1892865 RepID=A0A852ZV06_9ACTN|nr:aminopeptidase N [Allostreptomyces psammosilenae]